jgi:DNA polymerase-3 subunit alpha/error-prone DNA polymerase
MGVFYIESPAMRQLQKKTGVGDFAHIVIHSSIIRPAANKFINEYVRRLKGGAWEPLHPRLAHILDETYGILCYQEDVSKAAVGPGGIR